MVEMEHGEQFRSDPRGHRGRETSLTGRGRLVSLSNPDQTKLGVNRIYVSMLETRDG